MRDMYVCERGVCERHVRCVKTCMCVRHMGCVFGKCMYVSETCICVKHVYACERDVCLLIHPDPCPFAAPRLWWSHSKAQESQERKAQESQQRRAQKGAAHTSGWAGKPACPPTCMCISRLCSPLVVLLCFPLFVFLCFHMWPPQVGGRQAPVWGGSAPPGARARASIRPGSGHNHRLK